MRVVSVKSTHDADSAIVTFEECGILVHKTLFVSGAARACAKPGTLKNDWYYQAVRMIRGATRDIIFIRGGDPSVAGQFVMPEGHMKIAEFIESRCE